MCDDFVNLCLKNKQTKHNMRLYKWFGQKDTKKCVVGLIPNNNVNEHQKEGFICQKNVIDVHGMQRGTYIQAQMLAFLISLKTPNVSYRLQHLTHLVSNIVVHHEE